MGMCEKNKHLPHRQMFLKYSHKLFSLCVWIFTSRPCLMSSVQKIEGHWGSLTHVRNNNCMRTKKAQVRRRPLDSRQDTKIQFEADKCFHPDVRTGENCHLSLSPASQLR